MLLILLNIMHLNFMATQNSFSHRHVSTETHSRPNQKLDLRFTSNDQPINNLTYTSPFGKSCHKNLKFNYSIECILNHNKIQLLMKNYLHFISWPQILDSCDTFSCWEGSWILSIPSFQNILLRKRRSKTLFPN